MATLPIKCSEILANRIKLYYGNLIAYIDTSFAVSHGRWLDWWSRLRHSASFRRLKLNPIWNGSVDLESSLTQFRSDTPAFYRHHVVWKGSYYPLNTIETLVPGLDSECGYPMSSEIWTLDPIRRLRLGIWMNNTTLRRNSERRWPVRLHATVLSAHTFVFDWTDEPTGVYTLPHSNKLVDYFWNPGKSSTSKEKLGRNWR